MSVEGLTDLKAQLRQSKLVIRALCVELIPLCVEMCEFQVTGRSDVNVMAYIKSVFYGSKKTCGSKLLVISAVVNE